VDVNAVAEELYALTPSEFTATRDARAADARREGDRAAATSIKSLKKPSPPAWAVNVLARERSDDLARLVGLGEQLRLAQSQLRGDELRSLGRQRQSIVTGLAKEARRLVAARGHPISDAAGRQVEETLNAALADPEAARAVVSGRLVRPLEHSGMGPVDLSQAVATEAPAPQLAVEAPSPAGEEKDAKVELERRRARAEVLRQQLESAQAEVQRAKKVARDSDAALHDATRWRDSTTDTVDRLEHDLAAARQEAEAATARAESASSARDEAHRSLQTAREEAGAAADRLSELVR
jgi:hypothetical protein